MRRCKYFRRIPWTYYDKDLGFDVASSIQCNYYKLICNYSQNIKTRCEIEPLHPCYTPVEIDPYWKDIVDETNRRLNNV